MHTNNIYILVFTTRFLKSSSLSMLYLYYFSCKPRWIVVSSRYLYNFESKLQDVRHKNSVLVVWILDCFNGRQLYGCAPLVESTSWSFSHSWLVTGFVTRVSRWMPLVEQGLFTLPEHPSSPGSLWGSCCSIFSFCGVLCRSLFVLFLFLPLGCLSFDLLID